MIDEEIFKRSMKISSRLGWLEGSLIGLGIRYPEAKIAIDEILNEPRYQIERDETEGL